jgi:hypothetical protein
VRLGGTFTEGEGLVECTDRDVKDVSVSDSALLTSPIHEIDEYATSMQKIP